MGCSRCKRDIDNLIKYDENGDEFELSNNIFVKIVRFIMQMCFGIFVGVLFIIMAVPIVIYITICIIFNITPSIRIFDIRKILKKLNRNE